MFVAFFLVFFFLQKKFTIFLPPLDPAPLTHPLVLLFYIMVYNVVWSRSHWWEALRRRQAAWFTGRGPRLEVRLLLWDGGYFPIGLEFGVVGGVGAQGGVLPPHLQVLAGSRQLLHSLWKQSKRRQDVISHIFRSIHRFSYSRQSRHRWKPRGATFPTKLSLTFLISRFSWTVNSNSFPVCLWVCNSLEES